MIARSSGTSTHVGTRPSSRACDRLKLCSAARPGLWRRDPMAPCAGDRANRRSPMLSTGRKITLIGIAGRPGALWPHEPAASLNPGAGQLRIRAVYGNKSCGGESKSSGFDQSLDFAGGSITEDRPRDAGAIEASPGRMGTQAARTTAWE